MEAGKCIEVCNELLRGEISAVETYDQALEKFKAEAEASELKAIRDEHESAVQILTENVVAMGGEPSTDSGSWGTFAQSVQGASKLFGEGAAIWALTQGEEHGQNQYERALEDENVMPECKQLIRQKLLPNQKRHLSTLSSLAPQ